MKAGNQRRSQSDTTGEKSADRAGRALPFEKSGPQSRAPLRKIRNRRLRPRTRDFELGELVLRVRALVRIRKFLEIRLVERGNLKGERVRKVREGGRRAGERRKQVGEPVRKAGEVARGLRARVRLIGAQVRKVGERVRGVGAGVSGPGNFKFRL